VTYKTPDCETQLKASPTKLQEIADYFVHLSEGYGVDPCVTRVWDAVSGDSGVHEAHRAVDFRDEHDGRSLYTTGQVLAIVTDIKRKYPRDDGKLTCLHHSFQGGLYHFHLQIPIAWV
jgi:hypothetical protein